MSVLLAACGGGGGETTESTGLPQTTGQQQTTGTPQTTTGGEPETTTGVTTSASGTGTGTATGTTEPGTSTTHGHTTVEPGTSSTTVEPETSTTEPAETTTTGGEPGACQSDDDCKLHDDCCDCEGIPVGEEKPICKAACDLTQCQQWAVDAAICVEGKCEIPKSQCTGEVACDALPPPCPVDEFPVIDGLCWSGGCAPAGQCEAVPSCADCPNGTICVEKQAQLVSFSCEPIPDLCPPDKVNCECADELCQQPFDTCDDSQVPEKLVCICIAC